MAVKRFAILDGSDRLPAAFMPTTVETTAGAQAKADAVAAFSVSTVGGGKEAYLASTVTGTTKTINLGDGNVQQVTLQSNTTLTLTGSTGGYACSLSLYIVQDATGGRTITWPASVKWAGKSAPTLTTAANARDLVVLETVTGGTTWYATLAGLDFG